MASPIFGSDFQPVRGYRFCKDEDLSRRNIFSKEIAVPIDEVWQVFTTLMRDIRSTMLTVLLESSHNPNAPISCTIQNIPAADLISVIEASRSFWLHDQCAGIRVLNQEASHAVELDEHKLVFVHRAQHQETEPAIMDNAIPFLPDMQTIRDHVHKHNSDSEFLNIFRTIIEYFHVRFFLDTSR